MIVTGDWDTWQNVHRNSINLLVVECITVNLFTQHSGTN